MIALGLLIFFLILLYLCYQQYIGVGNCLADSWQNRIYRASVFLLLIASAIALITELSHSYSLLKTLIHYSLHLLVPIVLATLTFPKQKVLRAYGLMLLTMSVDLDHLLANPIFDPDRASIGYHPLHTYPMIGLYLILCLLPYGRLGWSVWWRAIGLGLSLHMLTDWQDYYFWH